MRRFQLFDEFAGPVTGEQVLKHGRHNQKTHGRRGSAELRDAADMWIGKTETSKFAMVDEIRGTARVLRGDNDFYPKSDAEGDATRVFNGTKSLLLEVADAPPSETPLYRGLAVTKFDEERARRLLTEGYEFEELVASWTPDRQIADDFAGAKIGPRASVNTPAVSITLRADGLPSVEMMPNYSGDKSGIIGQADERVASGRYRVEKVTQQAPRVFEVEVSFQGLPFDPEVVRNTEYTGGPAIIGGEPTIVRKSDEDDFARRMSLDIVDLVKPQAEVIKFAPGLVPVIKFNPRQPRAKDGRWTKGGAAWGGDFAGSPFEETPAETDYREQMENIDYIMGRSPFPPGYSYEGLPPPTVTLRQLGREQVAKVRKRIKKWKQDRERRYLENLSDEKRAKLIAANRARVDAKRAAQGLPPVVYKAMDPVLPLLYDVFRDVVDDPFVWIALIQDQRPLSEIDGDLGAILDDMLDAVAPAETVIKFAPGLRPTLKHLGGKHDQKTHGRGGQQTLMDAPFDEWGEDRAPRIRRMEKVGPSAEQIKAAMSYEPDEGVISEYIFEAYGEEINGKVEDYRDNTPGVSEDDVELFRSQLENQYYRVHRDEAEEYEKSSYQEALKEDFAEVYNVSHTGLDRNGRELTITSTTETVTLDSWDESVKVEGTLRGRYEDGTSVELGKFERTFSRSVMTSDGIEVEHDWFRIDEPDARGTGFGREFIQRQEDYYISKGVDRITVHAALEDGGYTWARAGFDWNPVHENPLGTVRSRLNAFVADEQVGPVKTGLQQLQSRLDGDRSSPDYPTPNEIATWGYRDGLSMWPGREIMGGTGDYYGSDWHGQKILTPTGIRETGRETLPVGTPTRKK